MSYRNQIRSIARSSRAKGLLVAVAPLIGALSYSSPAHAQAYLGNPSVQNGGGVRAGDFELHPGIAGEAGYDSNWFLRSNKTGPEIANGAPNQPVEGAGVFRVVPSLNFTTKATAAAGGGEGGAPVAQPIVFSGGVSATFMQLVGKDPLPDQGISKGNFNVAATTRLEIAPQRPLGAALFAGYSRFIQPNTVGNPDLAFNRSVVNAGGEVIVLPGGGTLDLRAGYQFTGNLFEESNGAPYTNVAHQIYERNRWRFRPRTAIFHETSVTFQNYVNSERSANFLPDATPFRTRLGLNGLLTNRVGTLLAAGYGTTFSQGGAVAQQFDSVTAQAELQFHLTAPPDEADPSKVSLSQSQLSIGFQRDFSQSYLGGFYGSDRGYASLSYFFAQKVLVTLTGGVGAIEYPDIFINSPGATPVLQQGAFTDIRVNSTLFGEYRLTPSLGLNATLDYSQNISDTQLNQSVGTPAGTPTSVFDMNWQRFQVFGGIRYFL